MAIINVRGDKFPIKAYLKADPYSQQFVLDNVADEEKELVTNDMFWGKEYKDGLYLDYSMIQNRKIVITDGISQRRSSYILHAHLCDQWLQEKIINLNESKVYVFQGYAGCGKTTFMNYLLRKRKIDIDSFYIDIGKRWAYPEEPYMFFSETLNEFDRYLDDILHTKTTRNKVWNKFIELGTDLDIVELDSQLPSIIAQFMKIKEDSTWNTLRINIHGYLNETFNGMNDSTKGLTSNNGNIWHNKGQTQTIVSLFILLIYANALITDEENLSSQSYILIFDNLDVITDPALSAENVLTLWGVMHRFMNYKKKKIRNKLPNFGIFIAVRKVLYSHITSHLPDLEMGINYNSFYIKVCDISDLYLSQDILEHRVSYWTKNADDCDIVYKLTQLGEITTIHTKTPLLEYEDNIELEESYEIHSSINLDAFFNHNYRALSNVLAVFLDDDKYTKNFLADFNSTSRSKEWQKVATLVFELSLLYKRSRVWNKMGFGCEDFSSIDYPTTLNRLILNYLYISKCGQTLYSYSNNRKNIPSDDHVSLRCIIRMFEGVKFIFIDKYLNDEQIDEEYHASNSLITRKLILERLADMCARNTGVFHSNAYGYDPDNDELWRRPLYFVDGVKLTHTAASYNELKRYFEEAVDSGRDDQIFFSITDEGFVLIHDIVANFEFYSARYCKSLEARPLHQATSSEEIDNLITPVYNAVELCCKRHNLYMEKYMEQYMIDKNEYLNKFFHPRTKPRFEKQNKVGKRLSEFSFRPQLHMVRVIYAHIDYFNRIKNHLSKSNSSENQSMCKNLTNWIEVYLNLYETYFYNSLDYTVCNPDNNVYWTLYGLLEEQKWNYGEEGEQKNVDISMHHKGKVFKR